MKRLVLITILLGVLTASCKDSDANVYTQELAVERSLLIDIPRSGAPVPFNLTSNEPITQLRLDDLTHVEIDSLSYKVQLVQIGSNTIINNADININEIRIGGLTNLNVNEQSGSVFPIIDDTLLRLVEGTLGTNSTGELDIELTGAANSPFSFGRVRIAVYMNLILTRQN